MLTSETHIRSPRAPHRPSTRPWLLTLAAIGALALIVGIAVTDNFHVGVFHDDAMYVILARSLATGEGYRYLNLPGAPVATHFPPGYPALLALVWRFAPVFPANVTIFKLLNAVFLGASAILIAQLVRERFVSKAWAMGVGVITAVSVPLLVLVTMLLSESLFLTLLLASLLLGERLIDAAPNVRRALGLGVLVGCLTLVRTHGVVLVPAVVLPLLLQRRWREAVVFAVSAVVVIAPWQLWSGSHADTLPAPLEGNYGSYIGWWFRGYHEMGPSMIFETLKRTVPETSSMMTALFSPAGGATAHALTLVALTALGAFGAFALVRRAPVTLIFLLAYSAIVLVWPFQPSRFVWGVWPLVLFVMAAAGSSRWRRPVRLLLGGLLLWVGAGYAAYEVRAARGGWWASISRAGDNRISAALAWTSANTSPADVVAADDEGAVFLYTGRKAVPVASFTTAHYLRVRSAELEAREGLEPLLAAYPVRAVLVGSRATFNAAEYLSTRPVPLLAPREQFDGGAAFTVLPR
ncbi:MAG: hypothetical protein ABIT20_06440 [Gemmatimonadaceae bacterium]